MGGIRITTVVDPFMKRQLALTLVLAGVAASNGRANSIAVTNPSFQADTFTAWPGYVGSGDLLGRPFPPNPAAITGWTHSGGVGINSPVDPPSSPFADNGAYPDGNQVAFMQGPTSLSQTLSGLVPGQQYWFQAYMNSRAGDSDDPVVGVTVGGVTVMPDTLFTPVGGGNPYTKVSIPFTATAATASLVISSRANAGGDAALVLDGITVLQRDTSEVTIYNPSFEASGTNISGVGYLGNIAGWTINNNGGAGNTGINQASGPFNDIGFAPEGQNLLLLQNNASASQLLSGLTLGQSYELTLNYAGRDCCVPENPTALVTIGSFTALNEQIPTTQQTLTYQFTADSSSALLTLANQGLGGDTTIFFDNVHLRAIPEPVVSTFMGLAALGIFRRRRS